MKVEVIKPDHARAPDLMAWAWAAYQQMCVEDGMPFNPQATPDMLIKEWVAGGVLLVMAFDDSNEPMGCTVYTIGESFIGFVMAVAFMIWVRPAARGKGAARAILAVVKQQLSALKVDLWIVGCDPDSPLKKIHESNGITFRKVGGVGRP